MLLGVCVPMCSIACSVVSLCVCVCFLVLLSGCVGSSVHLSVSPGVCECLSKCVWGCCSVTAVYEHVSECMYLGCGTVLSHMSLGVHCVFLSMLACLSGRVTFVHVSCVCVCF